MSNAEYFTIGRAKNMEITKPLHHLNSLITKYDIDTLRIHFIYKFGEIKIMSISTDHNKSKKFDKSDNDNHHANPSECVGCATTAFLISIFEYSEDFCLSQDEIRLGWIMIKPSEINLEDRYLISLSTDIQTEAIYSVFLNRKEKLLMN